MFCFCYTILDSFTSTLTSAQSQLGKCGHVYCVAFRDLTMCVMHNYTRFITSRIFENIPQNGPEYSHRKLAIARFLVTAVRKNIEGVAVLVGLIVKLSP